ncbi:MAG TPA: hypothetical protein VIL78_11790 [Hanamia sp.]
MRIFFKGDVYRNESLAVFTSVHKCVEEATKEAGDFSTVKYFVSCRLIVLPGKDFSDELSFSQLVRSCTYSSSSSSCRV